MRAWSLRQCASPGSRSRVLGLTLVLALAPAARAQNTRPLHWVIGAGAAVPTGGNPDQLRTGYQLQAGLEKAAIGPLVLRLEGLFNRFGFTFTPTFPCAFPGCSPTDGHERTLAATVDGIYYPSLAGFEELEPYLIAGAGVYNHDNSPDYSPNSAASGTDIGLNGGAGVGIPHLHFFLEVRAHLVKNAPNYIPFIAGFRF